MSRPEPVDTGQLTKLIVSGSITAAHSPVYLWLRQNHDGLVAQFGRTRIRWGSVATTLVALGVTDANGGPPQPATIRRTWWRVRRDVALAQARSKVEPLKPTVADVVHPIAAAPASRKTPQPPPAFDPTEGADDLPPPPRFRTAKLRD